VLNSPLGAKWADLVSAVCTNGTQQTLVLEWSDKDPEREEDTLDRSFTFLFNVNTTTGYYGVSKINGVYEWKSSSGTDPRINQSIVIKDIISFTSFTLSTWKFSRVSVGFNVKNVSVKKIKRRYAASDSKNIVVTGSLHFY